MKKFKLTKNSIEYCGRKLYQIQSLKDFVNQWGEVKKGDLGGYVEKEENLSQEESDTSWIFEKGKVVDNSTVRNNSTVDNSTVRNNSTVDNSTVRNNSTVDNSTVDKFTPISINGSRYTLTGLQTGEIQIGCLKNKISVWKKKYKKIGKGQNFTDKQIEEYKIWIDAIEKVLKLRK